MTTTVSPQPELTSTSTGKALMPFTAAEKTRASMGQMLGATPREGIAVFVKGEIRCPASFRPEGFCCQNLTA